MLSLVLVLVTFVTSFGCLLLSLTASFPFNTTGHALSSSSPNLHHYLTW